MSANPLYVVESNRCDECPTRPVCLAASVDTKQLKVLPNFFQCSDALAQGEHLYRSGDPVQAQYHVRSGMVKTYVINQAGDEYVTGFYLPGEIVGLVHGQGRYADSAVALETTTVCKLDDDGMQGCADIGLTAPLVKQIGQNASIDAAHQINLRQSAAQSRFAGFCLNFADRLQSLGRSPDHLPTPMSRTDLASYLGMTLESLSRVISKLHSAQVIHASRAAIDVLQPETLRTLGLHTNS